MGISSDMRAIIAPPRRKPTASVEERLNWLEQTMDTTRDELSKEEEERSRVNRELEQRLADLDRQNTDEHAALRQAVADARLPERAEWSGTGLVFLGLLGHVAALVFG